MIKYLYIIIFITSSLFCDDWSISANLHIVEVDSLFDSDGVFLGTEQNIVFDTNNFLGMKSDALDGYDGAYDIPEPPHAPDRWVSLYFPHPDWQSLFGNDFTSDYRKLEDLSDKVAFWDAEIVSDRQDSLISIEFDFTDSVQWPVFLKIQNESDLSISQYYRLEDNDIVEFNYNTDSSYLVQFAVGMGAPGPALNFNAEGGGGQMSLAWENRDFCFSGSALELCNNDLNHYEPTGYKIFRNYENNGWSLSHLITLSNHEISFMFEQIDDDYNEGSLSISGYPDNGSLLVDCYERYQDINQNGLYDESEEFDDFGQDGIAGTEDIGENDGFCNLGIKYVPDSDFFGSDEITVLDSDGFEKTIVVNIIEEWTAFGDSFGYSMVDANLLGSSFYEYYSIAYNHAGDGGASSVSSDLTSPNSFPIADAGDEMTYYLYELGQDYMNITLPYNYLDLEDYEFFVDENGNGFYDSGEDFVDANSNGQWDGYNNINQSYDFDGDLLTDYEWDIQLDDGSWELVSNSATVNLDLEIGYYFFRHRVFDGFNWGFYDYVDLEIEGLPEPAQVSSINVSPSLYYLELSWPRSEYVADNAPNGYDGNAFLGYSYQLYHEDVLLREWTLESFSDCGLDGLCPGDEGYETADPGEANGVYNQGEEFEDCGLDNNCDIVDDDGSQGNGQWDQWDESDRFIHRDLETNTQYCYEVYVVNVQGLSSSAQSACSTTGSPPNVNLISPNGGEVIQSGAIVQIDYDIENVEYVKDVEVFHKAPGYVDSWESIYYSEDLSSSITIQAPAANQIQAGNAFKIKVTDIGDFDGLNSNTYSDESDFSFIISSTNLSFDIWQGLNLVGSPLDLSAPFFQDVFDPYSTIGYFNGLTNNSFNIELGEGYYIYNFSENYATSVSLAGDLVLEHEVDLNQGWNLISSPLVSDIYLDSLSVRHMDSYYDWQASVSNNFISPVLIGYSNQDLIHTTDSMMEPFKGYWVHAPTGDISLVMRPHILDLEDSELPDIFDGHDWTIKVTSHELGNENIKDFIVIGTDLDAGEGFVYSEDIYDFPVVNFPGGQTNIYIDHSQDWFASNVADNGLIIESAKFLSDIRTPMTLNSFKKWNIKGEAINLGSSASVKVGWEISDVGGAYPINMLINNTVVDMRQESFIVVAGEDFGDFSIELGDESLDNESPLVSEFAIGNPYPNPFNPITQLNLNIPVSSDVEINVYDVGGNKVESLHSGYIQSGEHTIDWNASQQSSGIYFIKIEYQDSAILKKAILIK